MINSHNENNVNKGKSSKSLKNILKAGGGGAGDDLVVIENPNVFTENMNLAMQKWLIGLFLHLT